MALTEIEFDLPAVQFELMGYPNLRQGQSLTLQLEADIVEPDWSATNWYGVQADKMTPSFVGIGASRYAFAGQISAADIVDSEGIATATLLLQCGEVPLRVFCAPGEDGRLPFGTWETRYLYGCSRVNGIVEDDYSIPVGQQVSVTIWSFRRLVLRPGDAQFGQWHESTELLPTPIQYDRVLVTARVHRQSMGQ